MKVSGFILTALALVYLYLWRTDGLKVLTPAAPDRALPGPGRPGFIGPVAPTFGPPDTSSLTIIKPSAEQHFSVVAP